MRGILILGALMAAGLAAAPVAATAGPETGPAGHPPAHAAPASQLPLATPLPGAAAGIASAYGGTPIDVTTYHYDNNRTGWNPAETDLTPATVSSAKFGLLTTLAVDGNVLAQPLLVSNFSLAGVLRDILIVATGHDTVYAFDARTYALIWKVSLGRSQKSGDIGCNDVIPEYGISSTPVIVRSGPGSATLYVVSAVEPAPGQFHSYLHALNIATGRDIKAAVEIAPSATLQNGATVSFDPKNQWSRASLALGSGGIYVSIGAHCDNNSYGATGWLLKYSPTLALVDAFHTIETPRGLELASIWMSGFAPAIDASGNVFVVTGNGGFASAGEDYGESVLKLSPGLADPPLARFTPADYASLNQGDIDLGSGGVMLLPAVAGQTAPPLAVAMGKDANFYLFNQQTLGGIAAGDTTPIQTLRLGSNYGGLWGGPAFYDGPAGPTVFVQINGDVLRAFSVATGAAPGLKDAVNGTSPGGFGGSIPIVSSNGVLAHTGVVWVIRRSSPVEIEAYDAQALGAPIFAANIGPWSNPAHHNPFLTAMEANGRVYAPNYKSVSVFGLTP
jgi:outer membrane protein assembly factor BamB